MFASAIHLPSGASSSRASLCGTCFKQTRIFMKADLRALACAAHAQGFAAHFKADPLGSASEAVARPGQARRVRREPKASEGGSARPDIGPWADVPREARLHR